MHPFELVVNREELLAYLVRLRKIGQRLQNILKGSLGINEKSAISAAWLNGHGPNISLVHSAIWHLGPMCASRLIWNPSAFTHFTRGSPSPDSSINCQGLRNPPDERFLAGQQTPELTMNVFRRRPSAEREV